MDHPEGAGSEGADPVNFDQLIQRWSRKFGPEFKLDRLATVSSRGGGSPILS